MATTVLPAIHIRGLAARAAWRQRLGALWTRFREAICGLHGHDLMMRYEPKRICLECSICGYQTRGWRLGRVER